MNFIFYIFGVFSGVLLTIFLSALYLTHDKNINYEERKEAQEKEKKQKESLKRIKV